jgi:hypothetical protein
LEQTLNIHTEILQSKIKQLNGNQTTTDGAKKRKKSPACNEQGTNYKNCRVSVIHE